VVEGAWDCALGADYLPGFPVPHPLLPSRVHDSAPWVRVALVLGGDWWGNRGRGCTGLRLRRGLSLPVLGFGGVIVVEGARFCTLGAGYLGFGRQSVG